MNEALDLARRGMGFVEPNPMVGAVIVRDGRVVGRGWHARFGGAHAEVVALDEAGGQARGATLFVTLEPCCHFGKTQPCTDAILRAGINRVVGAMADPFPPVAGRGFEQLRAAGVEVEVGLGEAAARHLNRAYLTLVQKSRPYVHLKWAMSLDGKIATAGGESKWISGEASRRRVHELRGRMDAIIVGVGTVRADDPLLTARPPGPRVPTRVILASRPTLPAGCQLLRTSADAPVVMATTTNGVIPGVEVLPLPGENGRPSVVALLRELGRRRMTNVLVEGGSEVLGSFCDDGLWDELHLFVAPKIIGGAGKSPVAGRGAPSIASAMVSGDVDVERIGEDCYIRVERSATASAAGN